MGEWKESSRYKGEDIRLTKTLGVNDYVKYIPENKSYTISRFDTDYESDQTINPSELTLWRVIRKNLDGTVELVSEYTSSKDVKIWNYDSYVGILNKVAASYETDGYTVGSRHIGYDASQTEEYLNVSETYLGDSGYKKDMSLLDSLDILDTRTEVSLRGGGYWLAFREYYHRNMGGSGYYVFDDGTIAVTHLSNRNPNGTLVVAKPMVRPIIVLKSTLKIIGGDRTKDSPYILGI